MKISLKQIAIDFLSDMRGAILVTAAVMLVMLISVIGVTIDYTRLVNERQKTQQALDASILYVTREAVSSSKYNLENKSKSLAQISEEMKDFFEANYSLEIGTDLASLNIDLEQAKPDDPIRINAKLDRLFYTSILRAIGTETVNYSVEASTIIRVPKQEIVLVVDVSGSMRNNHRLTNLREALTSFVSGLSLLDTEDTYRIVSIIPFGGSVNFGDRYASWLGSGSSEFPNSNFVGCFRPEADLKLLTDAVGTPGPGNYEALPVSWDRNQPTCPEDGNMVTLFSKDVEALKNALKNLDPRNAGTASDLSLAWGWRTLSPKWRGKFIETTTYPRDFDESHTKILIFITDGIPNRVDYDGDGVYDWGTDSTESFRNVCNAIASQSKIDLYTIGYEMETISANRMKLLRNCISGKGSYFDANTSSIANVIDEIYGKIIALRLTK